MVPSPTGPADLKGESATGGPRGALQAPLGLHEPLEDGLKAPLGPSKPHSKRHLDSIRAVQAPLGLHFVLQTGLQAQLGLHFGLPSALLMQQKP